VLARGGPDVDHVVGRADRLFVVLHDDQRVPEVAQPQQRVDEPPVVPLVKAIEGSSRMYSTPISLDPILGRETMRCDSPPESVLAARSVVRYSSPTSS